MINPASSNIIKTYTKIVSVIIPAYNHEKYIKNALESVFNQSYKNIQVIIINDGSKDQTASIIKAVIELHKDRDIVFIDKENEGVCKTLNLGLLYAKGEYISFLASDDFWETEKIEKQVKYLSLYPEIGMVFTDAKILYEKENVVRIWSKYKPQLKKLFNKNGKQKKNLYFELMIYTFIPASSVMVRKKCLDEVGYFDTRLAIEDDDMWLRIAKKFHIAYIDEPLIYYREHKSNISKNNYYMIKWYLALLNKHFGEYPLVDKKVIKILILLRAIIDKLINRIKRTANQIIK